MTLLILGEVLAGCEEDMTSHLEVAPTQMVIAY